VALHRDYDEVGSGYLVDSFGTASFPNSSKSLCRATSPLWRGMVRSKLDDKADWPELGRLQTASWWWPGTRPYSLSPLPMQASE
jgi:hypothetical protein